MGIKLNAYNTHRLCALHAKFTGGCGMVDGRGGYVPYAIGL
jgi:hypothetical protein